ncbi:MAG TPA: HD domain-containing protein [Tenericutes bacterium]|nr:HD domain-containing protein [Mycoplasmatota bacterium]
MIEEFNNYIKAYDINDKKIKLKYDHSFRVMERSGELARKLDLSVSDVELAKLIGLLHDFGRFEQQKIYKTFDDHLSIDHANYSVDILFENNEIRKYITDSKYDNIIKAAIKNHNKFSIEEGLNNIEKLHAKIIRDADKMDILYAIAYPRTINIKDTEEDISKEVLEEFNNKTTITIPNVKNSNDKILMYLALIYDINYIYSIEYIMDNKILEKIFNRINNKEKFKKYFTCINEYMAEIYERGEIYVKH